MRGFDMTNKELKALYEREVGDADTFLMKSLDEFLELKEEFKKDLTNKVLLNSLRTAWGTVFETAKQDYHCHMFSKQLFYELTDDLFNQDDLILKDHINDI